MLKVSNNVRNVLDTDRDLFEGQGISTSSRWQIWTHPDQIGGNTRCKPLFVVELLVRSRRRVNDQGLRITDVGEVRSQLQLVDHEASGLCISLYTKGKYTAEGVRPQELLGELVGGMVWKTRIRNPGNLRVFLKPFGKSEGVVASSLDSKTQGLDTLKQEECRKWVQGGAEIWSECSISSYLPEC